MRAICVADISYSVLCDIVAARAEQCNGATEVNSRTQVSTVISLSPTPTTVNNGHVVNEQTSCRATACHNVATPLNDVLTNTNGLADHPACQKNGQQSAADVSLVHGSWLSTPPVFSPAVNHHQQSASRGHCFNRLDELHGVGGEQSPTQQFSETRQSYVNATRLERPGFSTVTSYSVTSSHTTSGSGPPRPLAVGGDSRATSQVTPIPVQVGGRSRCWAVPGPSVERSWETLRTDSTRSAVIPHKTTSSPRGCTAGPQDKTAVIIPVQRNNNTEQGQRSSPASDVKTHTVQHRVRSQCGRGHTDQLDIVVMKTGLALGFSIGGGKDSLFGDRPVTVKRVFRGRSPYNQVIVDCRQ